MAQSTAKRTLHYYWREVRRNWKLSLPLIILIPIAVFFNTYAGPFIISQIINKLTAETIPLDQLWGQFAPYVLTYVASIALGTLVFWRLVVYLEWKLEARIVYALNKQSFNTLVSQSMHFHNNRFGGSLVSQVNKFSGAYVRMADSSTYEIIPLISSLIFIFAILGPQLPLFSLALAILTVAYLTLSWFSFARIRKLNKQEAAAQNKLSGQLADSISNVVAVKSYGRESLERRRFANFNTTSRQISEKVIRAVTLRDMLFSALIVAINIILVVVLVGGQGWFHVQIGTLVLAITYSFQLINQIWGFTRILRNLNRGFGDAEAMTKILDEPVLITDVKNATYIKAGAGEVNFRNITFWHADATENDKVFTNFSLKIPAGQRVGLVGRSGSGKTTLTKLLLRFADVNAGEIDIDGQNITKATQESLRNQIAYVPQEPMLFHRSLRDNIAYGRPDATDDEIREAARQANALEFIEKLPGDFDTLCGERGVKLSGGQRQRIAIARAILKNAPILVLDEATSALDTESEKLIQEALERLMKNRTSIVIAHRLSTVAELDRIIVLDHGEIVEDGSHKKLLAKNGSYAKLWNRQTGALN